MANLPEDSCSEARFMENVANHSLSVIQDNELHRHLRFRKPGTIVYGFDILTWPGHLCITGDCGTYVFSRIEDMFEFFRPEDGWHRSKPGQTLYINPGYWGEKLLSIGKNEGYQEFCPETFSFRVKDYLGGWIENEDPSDELVEDLTAEVQSEILDNVQDYGEQEAYRAVYEFRYADFKFIDFWDYGSCQRHTFHYLWCLYAIAWGIQQYDQYKDFERTMT